jgi:hypothetical protein
MIRGVTGPGRRGPARDVPPLSWLDRLVLYLRGHRECAKKGHMIYIIDGEKQSICYQKGDVRPVRVYFSGKIYFCRRCGMENYAGPLEPYKTEVI